MWVAFFTTPSFVQNRQVRGQIRDEKGAGMPSVSILLQGTNQGTNADAHGNFSSSVPAVAFTLLIPSVG